VALAVGVFHEENFKILGDDEILITVVVEIDEEGGGAIVHPVGFGFGGKIPHGAVGIFEEKAVGKAALLAEVEVFESVAIDIAKGEAVVGGGIKAEVAREAEAPVVGGAKDLVAVGGNFTKDRGGDVGEKAGPFLLNLFVVENFE